MVPVYRELFDKLKRTGARVIVPVSGHDVKEQVHMLDKALAPVTADGACAGVALLEITLSRAPSPAPTTPPSGRRSNMMFFYPELVDMSTLGEEPIKFGMSPPHGIGGEDPRTTASAAVGERNCELAAAAIGRKAQELLASLPPDKRAFSLEALVPGKWWMV